MRRLARVVAAGALLAGLGLGAAMAGAPAASAHDFLVSTSPAADSTVTEALTEVSLTFNEPPLTQLDAGIAIEVRDASGADVAAGEVMIVDSTLSIATAPAAVGPLTVLWQTVSSDGHPVSGEFRFDYQGPIVVPTEGATPSAASSPSPSPASPHSGPVTGDAETSSTPSGAGVVPDGGGDSSSTTETVASDSAAPLVAVGVGAAVLLLVVVLATVLVVSRRRNAPGAG
jgi:methionine-rich copper-binding protein CopC